jgi:hypothetical protein
MAASCVTLIRRFREAPKVRKKELAMLPDVVRATAEATDAWAQLAEAMNQEYGE